MLIIQSEAYSTNEWGNEMFAGMFIGVIAGPASAYDDNGNGMPDCFEGGGPGPGPEGPQMGSEMGHLALGLDDGMGDFMEPWPYQHLDVGTYDMTFGAMDLEGDQDYVLIFSAGVDGELIEEETGSRMLVYPQCTDDTPATGGRRTIREGQPANRI